MYVNQYSARLIGSSNYFCPAADRNVISNVVYYHVFMSRRHNASSIAMLFRPYLREIKYGGHETGRHI